MYPFYPTLSLSYCANPRSGIFLLFTSTVIIHCRLTNVLLRIKRFTDVEVQTSGQWASGNRPMMVDACMQTDRQMVSTGCGPDDPPMAAPLKPSSNANSESDIASGKPFSLQPRKLLVRKKTVSMKTAIVG